MTTPLAPMPPPVAVVIPCYRVKTQILGVLAAMPSGVHAIYCIDDSCPEQSGAFVEAHVRDRRVTVLYNHDNLGVGGATIAGYRRALADGAAIIVKIDGDGQMDPRLL